jgi:hypothetical protein
MKVPKIIFNLNRLSDSNLETKTQTIAMAMAGNPNFPTPIPSLAQVTAAVQGYSAALSAAKSRDKVKVPIKNDVRASLIATMRTLANYVSLTAAGDRSMLISSGFDVNPETPSPVPPVTAPLSLSVAPGRNPGELSVNFERPPGAKYFIYQIGPSPLADQRDLENTYLNAIKYVFTGLVSLKPYSIRIGAIGAGGQVVFTDLITKAPL